MSRLRAVPTDARLKHRIELDDGTTLIYYTDGSVWHFHPVTGPACLRDAEAAS